MNNTISKLALFIMVFLSAISISQAQPGDELPNDEIIVDKTFNAVLPNTHKYTTTPKLPEIAQTEPNVKYELPTKLLALEYPAPKIKPLANKKVKAPELFRFYTKAGIGFPLSPYLNTSFNSGRLKNNFAYGLEYLHHSANNDNQVENQRFSRNRLNTDLTYFVPNIGIAVKGNAGYELYRPYMYGYNHSDTSYTPEDALKQFSTLQLGAELYNSQLNQGDLSYNLDLDFYNHSDNFDANETGITLQLDGTKYFNEKHPFKLSIGNSYARFSNDTSSTNNNVVFGKPSFTFVGDMFKIKLGAYLAYDGLDKTFFPAPDVEAIMILAGGQFTVFAGWAGSIEQHSFKFLTDENPYLVSLPNMRNAHIQDRFAGLRGKSKLVNYEAKVSWRTIQNLALYNPNAFDTRSFDVGYDTATVYNIHASASINPIEKVEISLTGNYNIYDLNNQEKAWHLPNFEANFGAKYLMMEDKLTLKGDLFFSDGVNYINDAGKADNLGGLFDISLGVHFAASKKFGIFLDTNNILNNKRERWEQYPSYGFNLLGGITLKL